MNIISIEKIDNDWRLTFKIVINKEAPTQETGTQRDNSWGLGKLFEWNFFLHLKHGEFFYCYEIKCCVLAVKVSTGRTKE